MAEAITALLKVRATSADRFTAAAELLGVRLPLRHDATCCGTIVDADGNMVFVVDMHSERPDAEVADIAELLTLAINTHAGQPAGGERG